MIIEVGTDKYKDIFGTRDYSLPFTSKLPALNVLQAGLMDPSLKNDAIDMVLESANSAAGSLYSAGLADLQLGSQVLTYMRVTASRVGGQLSLPGNGMLTSMTDGLVQTMQSFKVPSRMDPNELQAVLADAAFAIGLKGLGALGPIGKVAAAIIGVAKAIIDVVKKREEILKQEGEHRERMIYLSLPPLQQPDTDVDAYYVETVLRPLMESPSWTSIFSPRFESDEWKGIARNGGFAFAPGTEIPGVDPFGKPNRVFTPGAGVGLIPGLDRITSVVQVSLDPMPVEKWNGSGRWPVKPNMVTDVGKYYVNTGRLGSIVWGWATAYDASPDLYKIDVGVHNGPGDKHLHYRWKRYCDGGIRFMQETSDDWVNNNGKGRALSGDARYILGTGIGCAVGAWRCMNTLEGGKYERVDPGWFGPEAMAKFGLGKGTLGCVMDPPSMQIFDQDGDRCIQTLYEVYIRKVLEKVRARQIHFLWHSLVAAYVRVDFDAFRDPKMKAELMKARKVMLEHPDRKLVELGDVADDEPGLPGSGKTWKEQLIARGVRPPHPFQHGRIRTSGAQPGTLKPDKDPPPKVPVSRLPMPFGDLAEGVTGGEDDSADGPSAPSRKLLWAAGGTAIVGGSAAALAYYLKKRRARGERSDAK